MLELDLDPFIEKVTEENTFLHFPVFTTREGKLTAIRTATLRRRFYIDPETNEVGVDNKILLDFGNLSYHFCQDFLSKMESMTTSDKGFCIDFRGEEFVEPESFIALLERSKEVLKDREIPILEV